MTADPAHQPTAVDQPSPAQPADPARSEPSSTTTLSDLDPAQMRAITELAARALAADGVDPLSEAFRLALSHPRPGITHLLRHAGNTLVGYAQVAGDTCELVVTPDARDRGHGRALLDAACSAGARDFWAHGDLEPARRLGARAGLVAVRSLHRMIRPLRRDDRLEPGDLALPTWVQVSTFAQRPDVEALRRLNAASFAAHPEQGRLSAADLRERMAEPWFEPEGLLYLLDRELRPDADPVAFHWTKAQPGGELGEVYVVGVDPGYRGRGLAGPLTRLGLAHLAARGLRTVELYVDGDNQPALATYRRLGFTVDQTHVVHRVRPAAPDAVQPAQRPDTMDS